MIPKFLSEEQGDVEYIITPILVYTTIVFLLAAYISIWYKMRKSKKRLQGGNTGTQTNESDEARNRKEKKFVVLAVAFVLAFAFCWLPFAVYASIVMTASSKEKKFELTQGALHEKYLFLPAGLNSLINPFLYFKFAIKINICSYYRRRDR